jgi:GGDEF domain-containing protein
VAVDGVRAASEDELLAAADRAMYRAKSGRPDP